MFLVNDIHNFNTNMIVAYNIYKNPQFIRNYGISRYKYGAKTTYGVRTIGYYNKKMYNFIEHLLTMLNRTIETYDTFFLFINKNHEQYIHKDCDDNENKYAIVVYMNECNDVITGTELMDNDYYCDTVLSRRNTLKISNVFIESEFNKLIAYDGSVWHKIKSGFGNNYKNCRLSQTFFVNFKTENTFKIESENNLDIKVIVFDNYYVNCEDINFKLQISNENIVNNKINNEKDKFEKILNKKIVNIESKYCILDKSFISEKNESIYYAFVFISNAINYKNGIQYKDCKDFISLKQNRIIICSGKYEFDIIINNKILIEIIKIFI